jgi:DtxR family Mn-dependent transcriptional regulator
VPRFLACAILDYEMPSPGLLLLLTVLIGAAAVFLFWPPGGLWWRWRRAILATERVRLEDALKHLHGCEYAGRAATLESVAGALGLDRDRTAEVLTRLQGEGLAAVEDGRWTLSVEGRSYALRVVRTHRLWERYFSEETGIPADEWHAEAEIREHLTSADQVEELSSRMGHPRFDPHGDPIPTPDGDMPRSTGEPLPQLEPGKVAEIVHVEDEPEAVYSQLVAEGLHPGMRVRVLEASAERIRFEADAKEVVLAPIVAGNLSVRELPRAEMPQRHEVLSALEPGALARVVSLSPEVRGVERRRLLDLGLIPGTEVEAVRRAPGNDPTAYRIRGAVIALRREQAARIRVDRSAAPSESAEGSSGAAA